MQSGFQCLVSGFNLAGHGLAVASFIRRMFELYLPSRGVFVSCSFCSCETSPGDAAPCQSERVLAIHTAASQQIYMLICCVLHAPECIASCFSFTSCMKSTVHRPGKENGVTNIGIAMLGHLHYVERSLLDCASAASWLLTRHLCTITPCCCYFGA